jgi:hypothetical protein
MYRPQRQVSTARTYAQLRTKIKKLLHGHLSLPPPLSGLQSYFNRVKLLCDNRVMAPWVHNGELPLLFFASCESGQDALRHHWELRHAHAHRVLDGIGNGCCHRNDWRLTHAPCAVWAKLRGNLYQ